LRTTAWGGEKPPRGCEAGVQAVGAEQEEVVVVLVVVGVSGDMERGLDTAVAAAAERLVAALQVRVEVVQRRHNRRRGFMYGGRRGGEEEQCPKLV